MKEKRTRSHLRIIKLISNFRNWSKVNNIQIFDALRIDARWDNVSNRHIFCAVSTRQICPFEQLLSVPKNLCLSARTCSISKELEEVGLGGGLALNFAIAQEMALGHDSFWYEYLQILPIGGECTLPMFWSKKQRTELMGTSVYSYLSGDDCSLNEDFCFGHDLLQKFKQFKAEDINFDLFKVAVSISASRAFYIDSNVGECLVPWADLFNHSTQHAHVRAYCSKSAEGNCFKIKPSDLFVQSICSVGKHMELFNSFGIQNNASLLHKYGFCEIGNKNGFVSINIPLTVFNDESTSSYSNAYEVYEDGSLEKGLVNRICDGISSYRKSVYCNKKEFIDECISKVNALLYHRLSEYEIVHEENKDIDSYSNSGGGVSGAAAATILRKEEISILLRAISKVKREGNKVFGKYYRSIIYIRK